MFLTQKRILKPNVGAVMVTYATLPRADIGLKYFHGLKSDPPGERQIQAGLDQ